MTPQVTDTASSMWEVEAGAGSKREFQEGLTHRVRSCSVRCDLLEVMGICFCMVVISTLLVDTKLYVSEW